MKQILLLSLFLVGILLSAFQCRENNNIKGCYKGRLEIKGICMNYTIKVLEGKIDPSLVESSWRDEQTGGTHTNVFKLKNVCSFPADLKEGDEFYFTIDNTINDNCAVCQAYYPTPSKELSIAVTKSRCP